MRRNSIRILSIITLLLLMATSAFAKSDIRLSGVTFSYGSLQAEGTVSGIQSTAVTIILQGSGTPVVSCTSPGGQQAPGQNPPKLSAQDKENATPNPKRGHVRFTLEAEVDTSGMTAKQLGCPNNSWSPAVKYINWTAATITVQESATGTNLLTRNYRCTTYGTTPPTVTCTEA